MAAEVITFGCRLNAYESAVIRRHAAALDDTVVINTCTVTAEAERQARQTIRKLHRERPEAALVVTGCAVQRDPEAWARLPGVARVLGNAEKLDPGFWQERVRESAVGPLAARPAPRAWPVAEHLGRSRAILQVQQGCDHACTFCVIPAGRGPSRSVQPEEVIATARTMVAQGFQEIVLTGVDLTSYGADLSPPLRFGALLARLLREVPELPRLRLSSLDPAELDADFWEVLANEPRLMPHLHLSLQSASALILKRMKRRHAPAEAAEAIARARALRPGLAIGADLIAGFPTETEALFAETLDFIERMDIPFLHVFPFSPRPGTPAARMPQVPPALARERARRLRAAGERARGRFLAAKLGTVRHVLAETPESGRDEHFIVVRSNAPLIPGRVHALRAVAVAEDALVGEAL
jgi:threonylcarbamoyladenosine tRNA methylthiotransferase MtaB